ncbi:MAG TPA: glycosyltransferase family 4 protein [Vicinamibacterales bacterium]|nr:glycosyltransferase family 4 protein [Vicinamibacterales bacterium]
MSSPARAPVAGLTSPRILFLINEDRYFVSHRMDLARAARDAGCRVAVATRVTSYEQTIHDEGFEIFPIRLRRGLHGPVRETVAFLDLVRLYRRLAPDLVHNIAIKHVIYGSLAARLAGVPLVVNSVTGLGSMFTQSAGRYRALKTLAMSVLRATLRRPGTRTIFQNPEDRDQFIAEGLVAPEGAVLIRGSGVDLARFAPRPRGEGTVIAILPARMLWNKGVGEFVQTARLLRQAGVPVRCALAGMVDAESSFGIPQAQLEEWAREGTVEWWGDQADMPAVYARTDIVVLPSYYGEGLPKVLLEGAAAGRALITSDINGCREIVRDGENGFLVPVKDVEALAGAIRKLVEDRALREKMGAAGRRIVAEHFSVEQVARETLDAYRGLLRGRWPPRASASSAAMPS